MKKIFNWVMAATLTICGITMVSCFSDTKKSTAVSATDDASQFVTLSEAVPDVILEIRYFSTYNFVGTRIDGYEEPTALLTKQAADSLKAVSDDVKAQGYRLKIYDAYRPQKGVDHFVRWAEDIADTLMKPYFYPDLDKSVLFDQEYICAKSGHTRGSTVDLTLFDMNTEKELDMGGTFDWFGPESHPDFCGNPETGEYTGDNSKSPANPKRSITQEQFKNRMLLRQAMLRHGFKPFDTEWWHFTLKDEPFPDTYFTFPVKQHHGTRLTTMQGNFSYYNPTKLYFGDESLNFLKDELNNFGPVVLLNYGNGVINAEMPDCDDSSWRTVFASRPRVHLYKCGG